MCYSYFWESIFPSVREHATATERAGTKMIGLIVGCMRSHKIAVYDATIMNTNMEILALILLSLAVGFSCWLSMECNRFCVCFICWSVARITRLLSTSWNLKLESAYLCNSQGFFFFKILTTLLFSIFFKIVWILRMNWVSFAFSSPYNLFVMSLTSGKHSSSWKDAIALARLHWYSPSRKRMFTILWSALTTCCKNSISLGVSLCSDKLLTPLQ